MANTRGQLSKTVILVTSPSAGSAKGLDEARAAMQTEGLSIVSEISVDDIAHLPAILGEVADAMVVVAGGDGTVGAAAHELAGTQTVLGVLPLGTSNDFARSITLPLQPEKAVQQLTRGKVSTVDLGRFTAAGSAPRHFVHAATIGLNVKFAEIATGASLRKRLGPLTYAVAGVRALRSAPTFECTVTADGTTRRAVLTQLSVINAPVFGGALGIHVGGSDLNDRRLDVIAVDALPPHRIILGALGSALRAKKDIPGVEKLHTARLYIDTDKPLDVALDGEVAGTVPGEFDVAGDALHVVTPLEFDDTPG